MVGAVKEKFRATGDGAELTDDQAVVIIVGIMIQDFIFLKILGRMLLIIREKYKEDKGVYTKPNALRCAYKLNLKEYVDPFTGEPAKEINENF